MKTKLSVVGLMALSMSLFMTSSTSAASLKLETPQKEVKVLGIYNGKKIVSVGKVTDGKLQPISFEEYVREMNEKVPTRSVGGPLSSGVQTNNTLTNVIQPNDVANSWDIYYETYGYFYNAAAEKASPTFSCPSNAGGPCTATLQYTLSKGKSASVSLTYSEWSAVQIELGYEYNETAEVSASYQMPIPAGKSGYVTFAPKYHHSQGDMEYWLQDSLGTRLISTQHINSIETPQILQDGLLDGLVAGVII